MLLEPIKNKSALKIYYGLWEILIGFGSFIIFFGLFMKFYFHSLEDKMISNYIKSSISFYKPIINILNQYNILNSLIKQFIDIDNLNKLFEITLHMIIYC